jgi:tRNA (guanine-N7-)-methyltransferase
MKPRRQIEREFGVPIAGEILPPEQWSQTALKKLPEGILNWQELFGREAPVVLDLGCGNGRFLLGSAVWRPTHDHLGLDALPVVIRYATRRANQRGLKNIRFAVGGAQEFLQRHVAPGSVAEIHCYHPQPYHDPAQVGRRLVTHEFLVLIHRALTPGGSFYAQTDNPGYWTEMKELIPIFFEFQERSQPWPDAPKGRTRREIIALRRGLPVFRGFGKARTTVTSLDEKNRGTGG